MKKLTCALFINNASLEKDLIETIAHFNSIEIIDIFHDSVTVVERFNQISPDLLFIDMDNKLIIGMELIDILYKPPFIIAITSSLNNIPALLDNGFYDFLYSKNLNLDYFCRKMSKIMKLIHSFNSNYSTQTIQDHPIVYEPKKIPENQKDYMFVKHNKISIKVRYDEILYINNVGNALKLFLNNGKNVYHNCTLKKFLTQLPEQKFIRINNSTIININKIEKYHKSKIIIKEEQFNVSRIYSERLKKELQLS